jgi:hypothetical protein
MGLHLAISASWAQNGYVLLVMSLRSVASVEQQLTIYHDMLMVVTIFISFACRTNVPQPIS